MISRITGWDVVNLSVHGGLPLDFLYYKIYKCIREGDVVVLPLEYDYYTREDISEWFCNNMLAWGHDHYLNYLPLLDYLNFFKNVPPKRVFVGLLAGPKKQRLSQQAIVSTLKKRGKQQVDFRYYGFNSLTSSGEFIALLPPTQEIIRRANAGIVFWSRDYEISQYFCREYIKLKKMIEKNGGQIIVTWPSTLKNKFFDLEEENGEMLAKDFKTKLKNKDIDVCFPPEFFQYEVSFFYDAKYHLNYRGLAIRSALLGKCLKSKLDGGTFHLMSREEALALVKDMKSESLYNLR